MRLSTTPGLLLLATLSIKIDNHPAPTRLRLGIANRPRDWVTGLVDAKFFLLLALNCLKIQATMLMAQTASIELTLCRLAITALPVLLIRDQQVPMPH